MDKSGKGLNYNKELNKQIGSIYHKYYSGKARGSYHLLHICCIAFSKGQELLANTFLVGSPKDWKIADHEETDRIISETAVKLEAEMESKLISVLPAKYRIKGREMLRKFIREAIASGVVFGAQVVVGEIA
jgi:hypothetical protein